MDEHLWASFLFDVLSSRQQSGVVWILFTCNLYSSMMMFMLFQHCERQILSYLLEANIKSLLSRNKTPPPSWKFHKNKA